MLLRALFRHRIVIVLLSFLIASINGYASSYKPWEPGGIIKKPLDARKDDPFSLEQATIKVERWLKNSPEYFRCSDVFEPRLYQQKNYEKLPRFFQNLILENRENWITTQKGLNKVNPDVVLLTTDHVLIDTSGGECHMTITKMHPKLLMESWQWTAPLNRLTNAPYFPLEAKQFALCPDNEQEKLREIFDIVNEIYHFLMAYPLMQLEKDKWDAGEYLGKFIPAQYVALGEWKECRQYGTDNMQDTDKERYDIYEALGFPLYDISNLYFQQLHWSYNCLYWFENQLSCLLGYPMRNPGYWYIERAMSPLRVGKNTELPLGYIDIRAATASMEEAQGRVSWFQVDILIKSLTLVQQEWPKAFSKWREEMSPETGKILTELEMCALSSLQGECSFLQQHHPSYGWSVASEVPNYDIVYQFQVTRFSTKIILPKSVKKNKSSPIKSNRNVCKKTKAASKRKNSTSQKKKKKKDKR